MNKIFKKSITKDVKEKNFRIYLKNFYSRSNYLFELHKQFFSILLQVNSSKAFFLSKSLDG